MHIPLESALVEEARCLADGVVGRMMGYIRAHSTVSIERAVLRLLGVDGVDEEGVPWPNRTVDRIQAAGQLPSGVSHWLAGVCLAKGLGPQAAAEWIATAATPADWGCEDVSAGARERWALEQMGVALEHLRTSRLQRQRFRERLGVGPAPLRYLIVATGSIYEDVPQAVAAAKQGADIIAVIRATAQSLLDFVPFGATSEGSGGTFATAANFRLLRTALDEVSEELGRYIQATNYASGLCMPEISVLAAQEGLDMLLNDALYGILFRDINLYRTLTDQYFSRMVNGFAGILINTGEDNYLTTADAIEAGHTVLSSQFINERFAREAGIPTHLMGLGHAFEIDPKREDGFLDELAMAQLVRQVFPEHPLKYMPPTKHITGNIFQSYAHQTMYNLATVLTNQSICLLGILTEAIHTPFVADRYLALRNMSYMENFTRHLVGEFDLRPEGRIAARANQVLREAVLQLRHIHDVGLVAAIGEGCFADVRRAPDGGKGLEGVFEKAPDYLNPFWAEFERRAPESALSV
ncbi:MAG: lysine 5,6-aminomutase subunit alpha [Candidatus Sericytochromatia bacterium]|nr:lysine 5,6-aminomutase subunit alpha [Candidatus Sericytochromatia bacterium]